MNEIDTLADIAGRYAEQLKMHLPTKSGYGYSQQPEKLDARVLADLTPMVVAYSEVVFNLAAARATTTNTTTTTEAN